MPNDVLILGTILIDLLFILIMFGLGEEWIYGIIGVNLILISTFGTKLILIFGFVTNAGNVFYAATFFAVHMLIEHYGQRSARKAVWISSALVVLYVIMSQMMVAFTGVQESATVNYAITDLFTNGARLAIASLVPFILVQHFNIWLYGMLHHQHGRKFLWFRDTLSNITGQMIDSVLFFSIAFLQLVPMALLTQMMIVGFILKVVAGLVGTPLLYLSYFVRKVSVKEATAGSVRLVA